MIGLLSATTGIEERRGPEPETVTGTDTDSDPDSDPDSDLGSDFKPEIASDPAFKPPSKLAPLLLTTSKGSDRRRIGNRSEHRSASKAAGGTAVRSQALIGPRLLRMDIEPRSSPGSGEATFGYS